MVDPSDRPLPSHSAASAPPAPTVASTVAAQANSTHVPTAGAGSRSAPGQRRVAVTISLGLLLVGLVLVPRLILMGTMTAPARDGFRFIRGAKVIDVYPWPESLRVVETHPVYPLLLSGVHRLGVHWNGADAPELWVRGGQLISVVGYTFFMLAAFLAGCRLWKPTIAFAGCLAISIAPRQLNYSIDLLADSVHAMGWMAGFACLMEGLARRRLRWFLGAGLMGSFAYLTRIEAVVLIAASGLAILAEPWTGPNRWRFPHRLLAGLLVATPFLATAGGYALYLGRISPRNSAAAILGMPTVAESKQSAATPPATIETVPVARPTPAEIPVRTNPSGNEALDGKVSGDNQAALSSRKGAPRFGSTGVDLGGALPKPNLFPKSYDGDESYRERSLAGALTRLVFEIGQESRVWLLVLAAVALLTRNRTRATPRLWRPALAAFLLCGVMLVVLHLKAGYMAGRYLTPVLPLLAMYAMSGAEALLNRFRTLPTFPWERWVPDPALPGLRTVGFSAGMVALACVLAGEAVTRPLHGYRHGHVAAAAWLKEHAGPLDLIFDPLEVSAFYGEKMLWMPDPALPDNFPPRFAIIDPKLVYRVEPHVHECIARIHRAGRVVAVFPRRPGSSEPGVYVYELPPMSPLAQ